MSFRRSAAALFAGLFALQLVLAGVTACATSDDEAQPASAATSSASVRAEPSTTPDMLGVTTTAEYAGTHTDDAPCEYPLSPEQCRMMAMCTPGFLPAVPSADAPAKAIETVAAERVAMPRSVSFPPERRPPRA